MRNIGIQFDEYELMTQGPTLSVRIGLDPHYDPQKGDIPQISEKMFKALIDTGASGSCIDTDLATSLKLPIINIEKIIGVTGESDCNIYLAQMYIYELGMVIYGEFNGVHLTHSKFPRVLLGRDFLKKVKFTYDGIKQKITLYFGN